MAYPQDVIREVLRAIPWEVGLQWRIGRPAHVNVQKLRAWKAELKSSALRDPRPLRHTNAVDSRVAWGAWAKGRSSSWKTNGVL